MSIPIYDSTTERLYESLPEHFHRSDPTTDYALKKLVRAIGAQLNDVETVVDRFTYDSPEEAVPNPHTTSDLIDPMTANAEWLTWLAQLYGTRIKGRPERFRAEMAEGSNGFRGGTKAAMIAAAQTALIGNKFCVIYPHSTAAGPGTGGEWDMLVVTQDSETLTNLYPLQQATVSSAQDWVATYGQDQTTKASGGLSASAYTTALGGSSTLDGSTVGGPTAVGDKYRYITATATVTTRLGMGYNRAGTDATMIVSPGGYVSASGWVRCSRAIQATIVLNYMDSSNTILASAENSIALSAGVWTEIKINNTLIAPAGTAKISVDFMAGSSAQWLQNGDEFRFTGVRVVDGQIGLSWPSSVLTSLDYYIKSYPDEEFDELWEQRALTWRVAETGGGGLYVWNLDSTYHVPVTPTDPAQVMLSVWAPSFDDNRSLTAVLKLCWYNASDTLLNYGQTSFTLTNERQQVNVGPYTAPASTAYYRTSLVIYGMHADDQLSIAQLGARMESETPWISETADPAQTIIDRGAKPAGVVLYNVSFGSSWDEVEANLPTWNDWQAHTWTQIEEISLTD